MPFKPSAEHVAILKAVNRWQRGVRVRCYYVSPVSNTLIQYKDGPVPRTLIWVEAGTSESWATFEQTVADLQFRGCLQEKGSADLEPGNWITEDGRAVRLSLVRSANSEGELPFLDEKSTQMRIRVSVRAVTERGYRLTQSGITLLDELKAGETAAQPAESNLGTEGASTRTPRKKREAAEPAIAKHLARRPHDTAPEVAQAVGWSVGVVSESRAWKLNRERLRTSQIQGIDPKAIKLGRKKKDGEWQDATKLIPDEFATDPADEAEAREEELNRRIDEYVRNHPDAPPERVASEVGCTAREVECRRAVLDRLAAEQKRDALEDIEVEDPGTFRGKRQKWVDRQV